MNWLKETREKLLRNPPICKIDNEVMISTIKEDRSYGQVIIFRCPSRRNAKIAMLRKDKEVTQWI